VKKKKKNEKGKENEKAKRKKETHEKLLQWAVERAETFVRPITKLMYGKTND
jgi:hypothetical protein